MKDYTDNEILEKVNMICKQYAWENVPLMKSTCSFKGDEKYCTATTQKRCDGCTMYEPSPIRAKFRILVYAIESLNKELESRNTTINNLSNKCADLDKLNSELHEEIVGLMEENAELREGAEYEQDTDRAEFKDDTNSEENVTA